MKNLMIQHRDLNKIQAYIFIQRLYAYMLILRYLKFLSKTSGNKTKLTYPDGTVVDYTYDNANRLSAITNGRGRVYSYQYDSLGRRTKLMKRKMGQSHFSSSQINPVLFYNSIQTKGKANRITRTPFTPLKYRKDREKENKK